MTSQKFNFVNAYSLLFTFVFICTLEIGTLNSITMQHIRSVRLQLLLTSSPADSRPRELSPYYWPLPLRLRQTSPFSPQFSPSMRIFFTTTCEEPTTSHVA